MTMNKSKGRIKAFYPEKKLGFIRSNEHETDIFFHVNNLDSQSFKQKSIFLKVGQEVEFEVGQNPRGLTATNIAFIKRNTAVKHDTEDKLYWCREGERTEEAFVKEIAPIINKKLIIHPNKNSASTSIDLLDQENGSVADLKSQRTPFFTSTRYGYDPQYTVTFNHKDYLHYNRLYPDAIIYWWVNWEQLTMGNYKIDPMYGVWSVPFIQLKQDIENGQAPLHEYIHRVNDQINANSSYLFDVREFKNLLLR